MTEERYLRRDDVAFCLAHVVEECGEVLAAAGKSQRWGLDSFNPTLLAHQQESNRKWLMREIHDLRQALDRLETAMTAELIHRVGLDK
jgi:hypothetical protein